MSDARTLPYPPDAVEMIKTLQREKEVLLARAAKKPYKQRNHIMRRVIAIDDQLARLYTPNL